MKAILLSVQPKWLQKILNGEKTIEIRTTLPKCELPIDVYLYCTKQGSKKDYFLVDHKIFNEGFLNKPCEKRFSAFPKNWDYDFFGDIANGKVVAKFTLNNVYPFIFDKEYGENITSKMRYWLYNSPCLTREEIFNYGKGKDLYAWLIDNLQIFDKPKELVEFYYKVNGNYYDGQIWTDNHVLIKVKTLTKAPQSWQYVEVV